MSELGDSAETGNGPAGSRTEVSRALESRYRPAYRTANSLDVWAFVVAAVATMAALWLLRKGAPRIPVATFVGVCGLGGLSVLRAAATLVRTQVDKAVFSAPGLSDAERLQLVLGQAGLRPLVANTSESTQDSEQ